jgi:transcriptional regulator with XRE-family HTH domain
MVKRRSNPGLTSKVKELRKALDWTQGQLAQKAGVSRSYISLLEIGKVGTPSAEKMLAIARALRVPVETLYTAAGYAPEPKGEEIDKGLWRQMQYELRHLPESDVKAIKAFIHQLYEARGEYDTESEKS